MHCTHCDANFEPKTVRRRFCSDKCRSAAWQRGREDRESRFRDLVKLLVKKIGLGPEDFS